MFSTTKNWILNTLGIMCIPQNFWPRKDPEYLYQLSHVFPKQTTCEMKTLSNDFMMNRELISLWPETTLDIYLSAGGDLIFKLLRSRGRIWISCWKLFLSLASWVMTYIMKMYCSWCITILGYTCQIRKFGKFINIPSNTKFFRRSWITPLQKQPPEVF